MGPLGLQLPLWGRWDKGGLPELPLPQPQYYPPIPHWLPYLSTDLEDLIFCPQECVIKTGQVKTSLPLIPYLPPEKPDPS